MIGEQEYNEQVEAETFKQSQVTYNPQTEKDYTELKIQKHQEAIEKLKQKQINPEIEKLKEKRLHHAVEMHRRDKRISNQILDMVFPQMQVTGEKYPFRNKK